MPKLKSIKPTRIIPIASMVTEYDSLRVQKKIIEDRMKVLSEDIKTYAEEKGSKDDKGSFYANVENFIIGKVCKKSISLNGEKAIPFFKKKKLHDAIKVVESIDETAVQRYIEDGKLSYEDLESITETKVSYSVDVKKAEEMPEVEIKSVASAKPKSKLRK